MFCNFVAHYFSGFEVDYYPICLKTQQQQQQQQQDNEDFSTATYHNVSILKNDHFSRRNLSINLNYQLKIYSPVSSKCANNKTLFSFSEIILRLITSLLIFFHRTETFVANFQIALRNAYVIIMCTCI